MIERPPVDPLREAAQRVVDNARGGDDSYYGQQWEAAIRRLRDALASPAVPPQPTLTPHPEGWVCVHGYRHCCSRAAVPPEGLDVPDGTKEFVAFAVEYLALHLPEDHPTIRVGRRVLARLSDTGDTA